jgi:hypothetical protein
LAILKLINGNLDALHQFWISTKELSWFGLEASIGRWLTNFSGWLLVFDAWWIMQSFYVSVRAR